MSNEDAIEYLEQMWIHLYQEMTTHTFEDLKECGLHQKYREAHELAINALKKCNGRVLN